MRISFLVFILLLAGIAETLTSDDRITREEECDVFRGEWIQDPSDPPYTNNTCRFISPTLNCLKNGRSDLRYLHWRWKPHGCDLRPFLQNDFLDAMRGKSLGLVGDSIVNNQAESLVCILSQVELPVYNELAHHSKIWRFPTHNFTVTFLWTRFLLRSANVATGNITVIHLDVDVLDPNWASQSQYRSFDYVQISTGAWFVSTPFVMLEDGEIVGCHGCELANVTELGYLPAYRRALQLSFRFMASEPGRRPGLVLVRSVTPEHFEHGSWSDGGNCNRTVPYREGGFAGYEADRAMEAVSVEEFAGAAGGGRMRYMDVYHLSLLRPDAHPGSHRGRKTPQCDCLHWCEPGAIDTWNYLMMEMILSDDDASSLRSSE